MAAIASFSSGRPPAGVYTWFFGCAAGLDGGLDDVGRGREVGLAGAEADHVLALRLERLGLGVDGQGGGGGDRGKAFARLVSRAPMLPERTADFRARMVEPSGILTG